MDSETIRLAPVTEHDRDTWERLWSAYLEFYGTTLPPDAFDAGFAQLLATDPTVFNGLIAWDGDDALGLVHWVHHPHMWRREGVVYLQDLFTVPQARGKGVARKMIEAVYADADARGAPHVYWMTAETNYQGRILYDRIGRLTPFIKYERAA
ncbi:GNAT family N-acetyltransferase [Jannaschia donghaensis]|uniref:Acetyltransferase (GNAT) family protein n=1 Tax=Jannaschia donghaensis TaxID=420998 RepID=A0A0M6YFZ5_9RHOB|nr:GNAT family N-acetyltransferase [Jannaschia donghaensis]CTQ48870.1 Acetyltransferase (GNAT) family protein [Jannaschia donghaensis]